MIQGNKHIISNYTRYHAIITFTELARFQQTWHDNVLVTCIPQDWNCHCGNNEKSQRKSMIFLGFIMVHLGFCNPNTKWNWYELIIDTVADAMSYLAVVFQLSFQLSTPRCSELCRPSMLLIWWSIWQLMPQSFRTTCRLQGSPTNKNHSIPKYAVLFFFMC